MRQLSRQRASAAAGDDKHGVIGELRQCVGAFWVGSTDSLNDLAVDGVRESKTGWLWRMGGSMEMWELQNCSVFSELKRRRGCMPANEILLQGNVVAGERLHMTLQLLATGGW